MNLDLRKMWIFNVGICWFFSSLFFQVVGEVGVERGKGEFITFPVDIPAFLLSALRCVVTG